MLWDKSDPDAWRPISYTFPNNFDLSHHSQNDVEMSIDSYQRIPYNPRVCYDPHRFLVRYAKEERRLINMIGWNEFIKYPARTATYAFDCLCAAWLPEDADYYREMDYPTQKWFLETFYWHVVKTHLKWSVGYRCSACNIHRKHTGQDTLDLHHLAYSIRAEDDAVVSISGIEHLNTHALQVVCSRCHREAEHYW